MKLGTEYEAATVLGLSVKTLRADRIRQKVYPYYKIGRSVKYDLDELGEIVKSCRVPASANTKQSDPLHRKPSEKEEARMYKSLSDKGLI